MEPFFRTEIEDAGSCQAVATYKVTGFWTDRYITVYKNERRKWKEAKVEINWAAGGRDYDEVECDAEAARNFASALQDAAAFAKSIDLG